MKGRFTSMDWAHWKPKEKATILFVRTDGMLLLIHKLQGMGAGLLNGPGGRIEPTDPSPAAGAVREAQEELCITPTGVRQAGELWFEFTNGYSLRCHVFTASGYEGVPTSTPEAIPLWVDERHVPYERMWTDDRIWMPLMLAGRPFLGRFLFDGNTMLGCEIDVAPLPGPPPERTPDT